MILLTIFVNIYFEKGNKKHPPKSNLIDKINAPIEASSYEIKRKFQVKWIASIVETWCFFVSPKWEEP